jgi:hypothetical protein
MTADELAQRIHDCRAKIRDLKDELARRRDELRVAERRDKKRSNELLGRLLREQNPKVADDLIRALESPRERRLFSQLNDQQAGKEAFDTTDERND